MSKLVGKKGRLRFVDQEVEIYEDGELPSLYNICSLYHQTLYDFLLMTGFREQEAMYVTCGFTCQDEHGGHALEARIQLNAKGIQGA